MASIESLLLSEDPLSRDVALFLSQYAEEDGFVDYKLTMDISSERAWLELTKDISAFANTNGGYLFYGADDRTKSISGVSREVANILKDVNNIHQKINKCLEPNITSVRSKIFRIEGKTIALLHVPKSTGKTHLISKDGEFKHPSGKAQVMLRKGTFYVRRSGGNHLGDSRDLEDVIERRIDQFREALLNKVAKVVNSPASSDVFVLSKDPEDETGKRFVIEDSPDAIPIKGMSFTVAPEGFEEKIAAWSVLSDGRSDGSPPAAIVWEWYANRENLSIRKAHKLAVFQFSLWRNAPPFFWIQGLKNTVIREALLEAIRQSPSIECISQMLVVASFLGHRPYRAALSALGDSVEKLAPAKRIFPPQGPRATYGSMEPAPKQSIPALRKEKKALLDEIAQAAAGSSKPPGLMRRWKALSVDCFLYAQDDGYK